VSKRSPKANRIFLSYNRSDRPYVKKLYDLLSKIYEAGDIWYDKEIRGGQEWWNEIIKQIRNSTTLIYMLSRSSLESVYCRAEFTEAWRQGKHLIPVVCRSETMKLQSIKNHFQLIQAPDEITADHLADIIAAIIKPPTDVTAIPQDSLWGRRKVKPFNSSGLVYSFKVPANREPSSDDLLLCNTGILLTAGDEIEIRANDKITIDEGKTWMDPRGIYPHPDGSGTLIFAASHEAYPAKGYIQPEAGNNGVIGSLFGWISSDDTAIRDSFYVGDNLSKSIGKNDVGFLHLAVNDTKGAYADNSGEFSVTVSIKNLSSQEAGSS